MQKKEERAKGRLRKMGSLFSPTTTTKHSGNPFVDNLLTSKANQDFSDEIMLWLAIITAVILKQFINKIFIFIYLTAEQTIKSISYRDWLEYELSRKNAKMGLVFIRCFIRWLGQRFHFAAVEREMEVANKKLPRFLSVSSCLDFFADWIEARG